MLLSDMIRHNGQWRAARPAVISSAESLSWAEFAIRVDRVAAGLSSEGLTGERIGIVMDNEPAAVELIFGAMQAGVTAVPLNVAVTDATLEAMLADADIRALCVSTAHCSRIGPAALRAARLTLCSDPEPEAGWKAYHDWRDAQASKPRANAARPDALCNIIYSSGTTGAPKGIVHTQQARVDWAHDLAHALRYHSGARTLITTGIYSNITWVSMLPTLMLGGTLVLHASFDAPQVLNSLVGDGITHMSMVPVQLQRLLDHSDFDPTCVASLQSVMCCGSPLAAALKARLLALLPSAFFELYGSTEGIITTLAPEEAPERSASVGRPLPGEDLAILGTCDRPLPWGEVGEIVAASRFAMQGYWQREEATAEMFVNDPSGTRWLRSGDIGCLDRDGYLFITDRKKDMIISGGQNVYPADLEAVLTSHPDITDCAVIGVPSDKWGETPLALAVLRADAAYEPEVLKDWANARLGRQQKIGSVELRKELPRNANGKLLKRELRAPYWPETPPPQDQLLKQAR